MRMILIVCILLSLFGCNKKNKVINTIPNESWVEEEIKPQLMPIPKDIEKKILVVQDPATIESVTIYFDFDQSTIRLDQVKKLDMLSAEANRAPLNPLRIEGYCCPIGTDIYNYRLGLRRGSAVYDYLSQYITNPMEIGSYGESECVEPCEPDNYFKSRRVVIKMQ